MRGNSADFAQARIQYLNASGGLISNGYASGQVNPSVWTAFSNDAVPPTTTKKIRIRLETHASSGGSADAYFDAVELRAMRPTNAPGSDADKELSGPAALGVLSNGNLVVGGSSGIWVVNPTTQAVVSKAVANNGYLPPSRVSSVSVVEGQDWTYIVDPTDPRLHVRLPSGFIYRADVEGAPNGEPLAVAAKNFDANNDLLWLTFRSYQTIYLYKCPRMGAVSVTHDTAAFVQCVYQNQRLGLGASFTDDLDGTAGGERFRPALYGLANGSYGDLLISDDYNSAIRRNAGPYTTTISGGTLGFLDGFGSGAQFHEPTGLALAQNGIDVLVADRRNNAIRKIGCGAANLCASSGSCRSFPVDDHVACTTDTCEILGIRHTPMAANASCSDGNACNGAEKCDAAGVCQPGTPPSTDDGQVCTTDECDPIAGVSHTQLVAGTPCTTGNPCALTGTCNGVSSACIAGPSPLDDFNDCTTDACTALGVTHTAKTAGTACHLRPLIPIDDTQPNAGTCDAGATCVPNDAPSSTAVNRTVTTPPATLFGDFLTSTSSQTLSSTTACVYSSTNTGCAFVPTHMALVRGTVEDASGTGLAGVTISVLNHPEYGSTLSLANGEYFIIVNGGDPLTIRATKSGLLRSDRVVNPPWAGTDVARDIVLVALDTKATSVTFTSGGLASGTATAANAGGDTSKTRTAAAYFPPGLTGTYNGTTALPATAKFRVTEYTAGANGKSRMPADVAANTMYTYAAEFTLEDASGNLFDNVSFTSTAPVIAYVSNFLDMGVGESVPVGYYDRVAGNWQPVLKSDGSPSIGRVISVDASTGAVSGLQAGDPAISADELAKLGASYKGQTIWRLPLTHFSPLDFNIGVGAPACETQGGVTVCPGPVTAQATGGDDSPACGSCKKTGSIIDVERQVLRETFPVVGTPYSLNYSSENTLGYAWNKTLGIDFENHPKHSKLKQFVVDFKVAGKRVVEGGIFPTGSYPTWTWPKNFQTTWDGRDQDGRVVQGAVTAILDVGAMYQAERRGVVSFGGGGVGIAQVMPPSLTGTRASPDMTIWTRHTRQLQVWDASALGFGGWTINAHHAFDPTGNVIYMGDGTHRKVDNLGNGVVTLIGGGGQATTTADGTAVGSATFKEIESIAVGRDGEIYLSLPDDAVVRKISIVNGFYSTVADYAGKSGVSNMPANAADPSVAPGGVSPVGGYLSQPRSIALHDDGRLVIGDRGRQRIYTVGLDGKLRTLAGRGSGGVIGCGRFTPGDPATNFDICNVYNVATAHDGSVYMYDEGGKSGADPTGTSPYIARIDPAGRVWPVAGGVSTATDSTYYQTLPANTLATQMAIGTAGMAVDRNNILWISTGLDLVSVRPDGVVGDVPMPTNAGTFSYDMDLSMFSDGTFLRAARHAAGGNLVEQCNRAGQCTRIAGNSVFTNGVDTSIGGPAVDNQLLGYNATAVAPDGSTLIAEPNLAGNGWRILKVAVPVVAPVTTASCVYKIPAEDGSEYYCFDANGQHKSTVNAVTNGLIRTFNYDTAGLLSSIVEGANPSNISRTISIDRSTAGVVKIKSPNLQQTQITLDSKKLYATKIAGPVTGVGTISPTHDANNGLLTSLTDANNQSHSFVYDGFGRLQTDTDPAGGFQVFARTETATGKYTVSDTTRMGKTDSFSREILPDGTEQRIFGLLNGLSSVTNRDLGGTNSTTLSDGTQRTQTPGPDPQWGMLAPIVAKSSLCMPGLTGSCTSAGSISQTTAMARTRSADGKSLTDVTTVTGTNTLTYQRTYTDSTKTVELTSPFGRKIDYVLDAEGRVVTVKPPGVQQIDFTINSTTGRLDQVKQGTGRIVKLAYAGSGANQGFLTTLDDAHDASITTPLTTVLLPDGNGWPQSSTRKDTASGQGVTTSLAWNSSGQLSQVTPPGKSAHQLNYDLRGLLQSYISPKADGTAGGSTETTTFKLDFDRYLQTVDAPDSNDLFVATDGHGRTTSMRVDGANIDFAYYGPAGARDSTCPTGCAPGHVRTITDKRNFGWITTTFSWLNALPAAISETLSSIPPSTGTVAWNYNNDIRVTDETYTLGTHTSKVTFDYDSDGLVTCASLGSCGSGQTERILLTRDGPSGRLLQTTLGASLSEIYRYNPYGELWYQDTGSLHIEYEDQSSQPTVPRDAFGRVVRKYDRMAGVSKTFNYTYDDQNRLWKIADVNNALISEYRYDTNGNRLYAKNSAGTLDGTGGNGNIVYDAQDRLTKYGTTTFDYTPRGDIWHRVGLEGTTTYTYDALGALREVRLYDGRVITYVVDGRGRRVGKMVNGLLVKQWQYGQGLSPLAELDGNGNVRVRFVYGSKPNVPDLIKTYPDPATGLPASADYRVFSDQLGTPRLLTDTSGNVFKAMEFDEFGIKLSDTNASFDLVIGFAGGLYDSDTKLTRFGARDYDASIGRWVSKDPILFGGRQANLYVYAGNDPVNRIDPSGLEDGMGGTSGFGDGGGEGTSGSSADDPAVQACGNEFANCWSDCMESQGAGYASDAFLFAVPFGPTPKTPWELGKTLGGGSSMTTWASRASSALGLPANNALRAAGRYGSYVAGPVAAGAAGYWTGSAAVCTAECSF